MITSVLFSASLFSVTIKLVKNARRIQVLDYMEGLFLGSLWSDTDYENRRHISLFVLYGVLVCGVIALSYFTGQLSDLLGGQRIPKVTLFLILFLASPFLCFRYYRYPLWVKLPILLSGFVKYFLMTVLLTTWIMPFLNVSATDLQQGVLTFLNKTLESSTKIFVSSAGTFSTVLGVIAGGVYIVFLFAAAALLAVIIPGTVFLIAKVTQHGYDMLISKYILTDFIDR